MNKDNGLNTYEIKCNNINCDYVHTDIKIEDFHRWVNKLCPKCGNNLLTENDYNDAKYLTQIAKLANSIFNEKDDISMNIAVNDSGKIDFKIERN